MRHTPLNEDTGRVDGWGGVDGGWGELRKTEEEYGAGMGREGGVEED